MLIVSYLFYIVFDLNLLIRAERGSQLEEFNPVARKRRYGVGVVLAYDSHA